MSSDPVQPISGSIQRASAGTNSSTQSRVLAGPEVATQAIGIAVLDRLRLLDHVAYLRYASVYKGFKDLTDFEREVGLLAKTTPPKHH